MLSRFEIILVGPLLCWAGLSVAESDPLRDLRADPINGFPVRTAAEAVRYESAKAAGTFKFFLPVDPEHYVPIKATLAQRLSAPPKVRATEGLDVRVTRSTCSARDLHLMEQGNLTTVGGAWMEWAIEIRPDARVRSGKHEIVLAFDAIDAAWRLAGADDARVSPVEVRIAVEVWASREERAETVRRAAASVSRAQEARIAATRRAEAQLAEAAHRAAAAQVAEEVEAERQAAERRARWFRIVVVALSSIAVAGSVLIYFRKWLWPAVAVRVAAGSHVQKRRAVTVASSDEFEEPGTVLDTVWAQDRRGHRQRIKVEFFIASAGDEDRVRSHGEMLGRTHYEFQAGGRLNVASLGNVRLDVLISTGRSVPHGTYLAVGSRGAVRVRVSGASA